MGGVWGKVLQGIGIGVQAESQLYAGRAAEAEMISAQNIANYNAAIMEREAKAINQRTIFEQKRQAEEGARKKSALQLWQAGTGARGSELLEEELAAELELENLLIGYEGQILEARAKSQAELDRLQGRLYRERGKTMKKASYFQAGSTLLQGFGSMGGGFGKAGGTTGWTQKGTGSMGYASGYGGGFRMR